MKIEQGDWVVVCDGNKALFLENAGDDKFPNLQTREVFEQDNPPTRDRAPMRRAARFVGRHMRAARWSRPTGTKRPNEDFLRDLAAARRRHRAGQIKALVIVAPPRALGDHAAGLLAACALRLRGEVDKDFVKMPVHEIEKHLTGTPG